jgi:hypothetical protein
VLVEHQNPQIFDSSVQPLQPVTTACLAIPMSLICLCRRHHHLQRQRNKKSAEKKSERKKNRSNNDDDVLVFFPLVVPSILFETSLSFALLFIAHRTIRYRKITAIVDGMM